jgi:hypothetical protein
VHAVEGEKAMSPSDVASTGSCACIFQVSYHDRQSDKRTDYVWFHVNCARRRREGAHANACHDWRTTRCDQSFPSGTTSTDTAHAGTAYASLIAATNPANRSAGTSIMRPPVSSPNASCSRGGACVKL